MHECDARAYRIERIGDSGSERACDDFCETESKQTSHDMSTSERRIDSPRQSE